VMKMESKNDESEQKFENTPIGKGIGTYVLGLQEDGWGGYWVADEVLDLENPRSSQVAIGFKDSMGKKQVVVCAPLHEWLKVLTKIAKKAAAKPI